VIAAFLVALAGAYLYLNRASQDESLEERLASLRGEGRRNKVRGRQAVYENLGSRLTRPPDDPEKPSVSADLALLGIEPAAFAGQVLGYGLGLFVIPAAIAMTSLFGVKVPTGLLLVLALILGLAGAMVPFSTTRRAAEEKREHLREVIAMITGLVPLNLSGGAGIEDALTETLRISDDWGFALLRRPVGLAAMEGRSLWGAIDDKLRELGINAFRDIRATLELGGSQGARVAQTLSAKAASLRTDEVRRAEERRNRKSESMYLPGILILFGLLGMFMYPEMAHILKAL
jgi:hypothetical protein